MRRVGQNGTFVALVTALLCGCRSAPDVAEAPLPPRASSTVQQPGAPPKQPVASPIRLASAQEPVAPKDDKKAEAKEKIDLPMAVQLCTLQNFRLRASATKIAQAEADLL